MQKTATQHTIRSLGSGSTFVINESVTESDMRRHCPLFFRTPHGKRETYEAYRGFLIVRNTVKFTGMPPERRTVIYLFAVDASEGNNKYDTNCVSTGNCKMSTRQAKRYIDDVIAKGEYQFS